MRPLLELLAIAAGAVTAFFWLLVPDRPPLSRGHSSSVGWLIFALTHPTVPAWTAAASC